MDNFITNNFTDKTIYNGEYVVFPLKENNVKYVLESTMYRIDTNKLVSNNINYFATGNKIEGIFSGKSVVYKLDLKNNHNLKTAEEFPTNGDTVLIVSVEPGYYVKLTLDVVNETPVETIDNKTMAEIRHETAINLIMRGTEIVTWYQSFKDGSFCAECHHTGLDKVIAIEDDGTYTLSLEDHRHYVIYAEIYNDNNELRKYYREIFTGENMIEDDPQIKHIIEYKAQITPEGIDIDYLINLNINNECLKVIRPDKTSAMIRLVDLGTYDQNDTDLLRWQAGYELGDLIYWDRDRKLMHHIELDKRKCCVFNGTLVFNISDYYDLVVVERVEHDDATMHTCVINPDTKETSINCFAGCSIRYINDNIVDMPCEKYLVMDMDTSELKNGHNYEIEIYGIPNKKEDYKSPEISEDIKYLCTLTEEPSETTKDLDYLCKLFEKNKHTESKPDEDESRVENYPDDEKIKRANKIKEILATLRDPESKMSDSEKIAYVIGTWFCGDLN